MLLVSKKKASVKRGERRPSDVTLRLIGYEWSSFPQKLADAVKASALNKDQIAEKAGVSPSMLTRLPANMSWWSVVALARALGITVGELLGEQPRGDGAERPKISASPHLVDAHEVEPKADKLSTDERPASRKARK